MQQVRVSKW